MNPKDKTIRLGVSRHLQDYNGYCGPACALMVVEFTGSAKSPPVFAQNEFFREIRTNARASKDRRPVKSPAESLLTMLNDHTAGEMQWTKIFNPDPFPVAKEIFLAIEEKKQPCLLLVSKGMHWVVAFGVQRMENGRPAGYLLRDPAWAGMPKFYGLSIFPDTPAIAHSESPCPCLSHTDGSSQPTGCVHERYITVMEMLSHRGLQGSPDWEGKGAIAIVPDSSGMAAVVPESSLPELARIAPAGVAIENPQEKAGAAALKAVRENGLYGRPDSPEEWDKALTGATAGEPILVKDPEHSADDFYLVPLNPADPTAKRGAWAMLDAKTLALREVSLLENWQTPAFPSNDSDDAQKASEQQHTLPDGTKAHFKKDELKPNTKNLVWAASAASVLPYWPVKELLAPHPVTGEPVSIYVTQDGGVLSQLVPDNIEIPEEMIGEPRSNKLSKSIAPKLIIGALVITAAVVIYYSTKESSKPDDTRIQDTNEAIAEAAAETVNTPKVIDESIQSKQSEAAVDKVKEAAADAVNTPKEVGESIQNNQSERSVDSGVKNSKNTYLASFYLRQFSGRDTDTDRKTNIPSAFDNSKLRINKGSYQYWDAKYYYLVIHKNLSQYRIQGKINGIRMSSVTWHRTEDISKHIAPNISKLSKVKKEKYLQLAESLDFPTRVSVVNGKNIQEGGLIKELSVQAPIDGIYILRTPITNFNKP